MGGNADQLSNVAGRAVGVLAMLDALRAPGGLSNMIVERQKALGDPNIRAGLAGSPFTSGFLGTGGHQVAPAPAVGPPTEEEAAYRPGQWVPNLPPLGPLGQVQQAQTQLLLSGLHSSDAATRVTARRFLKLPGDPADEQAVADAMQAGLKPGQSTTIKTSLGSSTFAKPNESDKPGVAPVGATLFTQNGIQYAKTADGKIIRMGSIPQPPPWHPGSADMAGFGASVGLGPPPQNPQAAPQSPQPTAPPPEPPPGTRIPLPTDPDAPMRGAGAETGAPGGSGLPPDETPLDRIGFPPPAFDSEAQGAPAAAARPGTPAPAQAAPPAPAQAPQAPQAPVAPRQGGAGLPPNVRTSMTSGGMTIGAEGPSLSEARTMFSDEQSAKQAATAFGRPYYYHPDLGKWLVVPTGKSFMQDFSDLSGKKALGALYDAKAAIQLLRTKGVITDNPVGGSIGYNWATLAGVARGSDDPQLRDAASMLLYNLPALAPTLARASGEVRTNQQEEKAIRQSLSLHFFPAHTVESILDNYLRRYGGDPRAVTTFGGPPPGTPATPRQPQGAGPLPGILR